MGGNEKWSGPSKDVGVYITEMESGFYELRLVISGDNRKIGVITNRCLPKIVDEFSSTFVYTPLGN